MGLFDPIQNKGLMNKNEASQMEEQEEIEKRDNQTQPDIDHAGTRKQKKYFDKKYPREENM